MSSERRTFADTPITTDPALNKRPLITLQSSGQLRLLIVILKIDRLALNPIWHNRFSQSGRMYSKRNSQLSSAVGMNLLILRLLFCFTLLPDCETLILQPAFPSADSGDQPMRMKNKKVISYHGRYLTKRTDDKITFRRLGEPIK